MTIQELIKYLSDVRNKESEVQVAVFAKNAGYAEMCEIHGISLNGDVVQLSVIAEDLKEK